MNLWKWPDINIFYWDLFKYTEAITIILTTSSMKGNVFLFNSKIMIILNLKMICFKYFDVISIISYTFTIVVSNKHKCFLSYLRLKFGSTFTRVKIYQNH